MNTSKPITHTTSSKDGTTIGYRSVGTGPGLVIVHGSMSSGYHHLDLAVMLADHFTVHLIDRRGRGLSGPYKSDHSIADDVADVQAVLKATGSELLCGVSVGGLIALETARTTPGVRKLAVYEPLIYRDQDTPRALTVEVDRQLAAGNLAGAMASALQKAHLGPALMDHIPHNLMTLMSRGMLNWTPKTGDYVPGRELAASLGYEGRIITERSGQQTSFASVHIPTLLLNGSKSSAFLKDATARVAKVLPAAHHTELPGLDHSSTWNKAVRGKPELIAKALGEFFAD